MPFGDEMTGICSRWANAVSSREASDSVTPWPTKITGRAALEDHLDRGRDFVGRGAAALRVQDRRRRRHLDVVLLLEHVERDIDVDRARPSRQHRGHGLAQGERQHVDAGRLEAALHHRPDDVGEVGLIVAVDFLERAAVELRGRHIGGDREHRRRIAQRQRERHHDIAGARTAGGERRGRLVADAEIGIRHMRGDLLVARRDELDPVARAVEGIEQPDIAVPADAEHVGNLVVDQVLGDQIGALHPRHCLPSYDRRKATIEAPKPRRRSPGTLTTEASTLQSKAAVGGRRCRIQGRNRSRYQRFIPRRLAASILGRSCTRQQRPRKSQSKSSISRPRSRCPSRPTTLPGGSSAASCCGGFGRAPPATGARTAPGFRGCCPG